MKNKIMCLLALGLFIPTMTSVARAFDVVHGDLGWIGFTGTFAEKSQSGVESAKYCTEQYVGSYITTGIVVGAYKVIPYLTTCSAYDGLVDSMTGGYITRKAFMSRGFRVYEKDTGALIKDRDFSSDEYWSKFTTFGDCAGDLLPEFKVIDSKLQIRCDQDFLTSGDAPITTGTKVAEFDPLTGRLETSIQVEKDFSKRWTRLEQINQPYKSHIRQVFDLIPRQGKTIRPLLTSQYTYRRFEFRSMYVQILGQNQEVLSSSDVGELMKTCEDETQIRGKLRSSNEFALACGKDSNPTQMIVVDLQTSKSRVVPYEV